MNDTTGASDEDFPVWTFDFPGDLSVRAGSGFNAHTGFSHTLANSTTREAYSAEGLLSAAIVKFPDLGLSDGPKTNEWINRFEAYTCSIDLCGHSYVNWTMVNGTLNHGIKQKLKLNITQEDMFKWGLSPPSDGEFLETDTFTINYFDVFYIGNVLTVMLNLNHGGNIEPHDGYVAAFHESPDIAATIENITTSMSYRLLSGPNATAVHGNVYALQTYVFVRWAWITLPVVVELAACGLLAAVIIMTRRARHLVWKSSLTPLLLTDDSYPSLHPAEDPPWTITQSRERKNVIINHVTK